MQASSQHSSGSFDRGGGDSEASDSGGGSGSESSTEAALASALVRRTPALVLDYVDGGTLSAALLQRDHPLLRSGEGCLQLLREVAAGIAYLHSRGVTHFTLTPRNILLGGHDVLAARVGG